MLGSPLRRIQRNRANVPGAQSSWVLSTVKDTESARAVVWWQYGGFRKPSEKRREIPPYGEGQHFCLMTTGSVSRCHFPAKLKGCLAAGM